MKRAEILRRLEERLARGEISETTYLEIKARYGAEPEEPEREDVARAHAEHAGHPDDLGAMIERSIRESLEPALRNMPDLERRIRESVEPALAGMRFADFGEGVQARNGYVKIAGSGVVTGNPVRAREFKSAGSGRVTGDLEADTAKSAGSCVFEGSVTAHEFHTAGSAKVGGRLRGTEVHSSGTLSVGGDVEAREVHVRGSMDVGGRTTSEEFHLSGSGRFGGPIESREIDIELGGDVSVPALHGTEILVRRPGGFFRGRCELRTERIAAREVRVECTTADLVVGEEVVIGPHSRIGVVEARELTVHESSEVKERRGLTRSPDSYQAGRAGSAGVPPSPPPAAPPSPPAPPAPPSPPG
ncbi:MAG TPA: hypothetical protein VI915_03590 [Thermoplasmata archaeon]|nr:MAG: hypothetical protein A3K65_04695 [Euryarchaeota archaeon RBG_16_68_12]HKZ89420.1 hypothetical protein [Thermoplasmata archaeon]HLE46059.1 hypothetical protein [Thermoplasmata archaeon]